VTGKATVRRFLANGQLDTTFGQSGTAQITLGDDNTAAEHLEVLADGKILVGLTITTASGATGGAVVRLNADGSADLSLPPLRHAGAGQELAFGTITSGGEYLYAEGGLFAPATLRRLLLSGTSPSPVSLSGGILSVQGTDGPDRMSVSRFGTDLAVDNGDGYERVFTAADVTRMTVSALGGNDTVLLSDAGDIPANVSGGDGDDRIAGGDGNDSLSGNAGRDQLAGGPGNDRLAGNGGRDKLSGGDGNDRLYGGAGGDGLAGGADDDTINGEGGNDRIDGGTGRDFLHGNAGDDRFFAGSDNALDSLLGDRGHDTATADATDVLTSIED
jgi:Ca2+-binding RTX toxin-like protein